MDTHLYLLVFPNEALVASQLSPEEFGRYYATGSPRHFSGKVIFAELDNSFRHPFFEIDRYLSECVPHPDSTPKKTKFIASYRVLEHIDFDALQKLYLITVDGKTLPLEKGEYNRITEKGEIFVYQNITPLNLLVASNSLPLEYGRYITLENKAKSAPNVCFTQIELDVEEILRYEEGSMAMYAPLPNVHPSNLRECLKELKAHPDKRSKTISLSSILPFISYEKIKHGFWFCGGEKIIFYTLPTREDLENKYYNWCKSAYHIFQD